MFDKWHDKGLEMCISYLQTLLPESVQFLTGRKCEIYLSIYSLASVSYRSTFLMWASVCYHDVIIILKL